MKNLPQLLAISLAIGTAPAGVSSGPAQVPSPSAIERVFGQEALNQPLLSFNHPFRTAAKAAVDRLIGIVERNPGWFFTPQAIAVGGYGTHTDSGGHAIARKPAFMAVAREGGSGTRARRIDPQSVQYLIQYTADAREAVQVLRSAFDWSPTPEQLYRFLQQHHLTAPWPVKERAPKVDPEEVRRVIQYTTSASEALQVLRSAIGWAPTTPAALSSYLQYHGLVSPWQKRRDPGEIQALVRTTANASEALLVLREKLGWCIARSTLGNYLKRHGISTPWRRPRKRGAIRFPLMTLLGVAVLVTTSVFPPGVWERIDMTRPERVGRHPALIVSA
jgi:hypothetical protein